jgi:fumarate hydratase class II
MTDGEPMRVEHDSMGKVRVPAGALWQAQTQRAIENFPISGRSLPTALIHALAAIKREAAPVNAALGALDQELVAPIVAAAAAIEEGQHDDQFPIDVFQTGSGTSTNMNVNEVIATLASAQGGRTVHPNDHVNRSQSSNDVFPSAIHIAATESVVHDLQPALRHLAHTLRHKADEMADVVKAGRTHLMDATPVTLGQELGGYATAIEHGVERLNASLPRLGELPLGGTAVGTGINCPPGFAVAVIERLAERLQIPLREARDHFEAQGARDALVETSGQLRTIAVSLNKVASDLRWMSSGPAAGLAEILLPELQPGSSIMPGKVNPVMAEATQQVVAQVIGNDATIAFAGSLGNFELNVMMPVMANALLQSIALLANVSRLLADRAIAGLTADRERLLHFAESSSAIATSLAPLLGYETVASVVHEAVSTKRTIIDVLTKRGLATDEVIALLDVRKMT